MESASHTSQMISLARRAVFGVVCGVLAGAASALFLRSLKWAGEFRDSNMILIWGLPLAGLAIGLLYHYLGQNVSAGTGLILDELHTPKNQVPLKMTPFILFSTVLTHLFGGSAGREGTAVQMGGALADQFAIRMKVSALERRALLVAGLGAGFGSAIGAPCAGVIFGIEIVGFRQRPWPWVECIAASLAAWGVTWLLRAPHTHFAAVEMPALEIQTLFWTLVAAALFGGTARVFMKGVHVMQFAFVRFLKFPPLRPLVGGVILSATYSLEGSYRYCGLGLGVIQESLFISVKAFDPLLKSLFTGLTLASGFKGGEFIPLVFIGSTLGSVLGLVLPVSGFFLASIGFAAVFAGASGAPLACAVMAIEIFGPGIAVYAIPACLISSSFAGSRRIYSRRTT